MLSYNYDMRDKVKESAVKALTGGFIRWAVGFVIPAETQDDKTEKYSIIAIFSYPFEAEEFIDRSPSENKDRFFITRIDNLQGA